MYESPPETIELDYAQLQVWIAAMKTLEIEEARSRGLSDILFGRQTFVLCTEMSHVGFTYVETFQRGKILGP